MAELTFNNVMIGSPQPDVLGEFYGRVFDRAPDMKEAGWYGWQVGAAWLSIGEHSEVASRAKEPQRLILNFEGQADGVPPDAVIANVLKTAAEPVAVG